METPFANPDYFPFGDIFDAPADDSSNVPPPTKNHYAMSELRKALDDVVDNFTQAGITYVRFRREVKNAWERKNPPTPNAHITCYHAFVKHNMSGVRDAHPEATHAEHMRIIGNMWQEQKPKSKRVTGIKRDAAELDME
jgi:hypothetical protein